MHNALQGSCAVHAKNFGNVRFVRDESVHIENIKNYVQCLAQQELWDCASCGRCYESCGRCAAQVVRIVGGAFSCVRFYGRSTRKVRTIARIVGGAMGCGVSRRKSIRG